MATRKCNAKKRSTVKKPAPEKISPEFIEALKNIEKMGKELLNNANDPFKMGCNVADELRKIANRIENETMTEGISQTEASYTSEFVVGVGVGVI